MAQVPMVSVPVRDGQGADRGTLELPPRLAAGPLRLTALHEVVLAHEANQRSGTAAVKDRGAVSGGGKKPWRQKGTGRARHGSIRSPIWKGGGVAHGPRPRSYRVRLARRVRQLGLATALRLKVKDQALLVLDGPLAPAGKTKEVVTFLRAAQATVKPLLIVREVVPCVGRAVRNVPGLTVARAADVNGDDVVRHRTVVVGRSALPILEARVAGDRDA